MKAPVEVFRVVLDPTKCDAHGICSLCLPQRLTLDRWGYPQVDEAPLDSRRLLILARRAVAACPEGALDLRPTASAALQADARRRAV